MEKEKLMRWISLLLTFCFVVACFGLGHAAYKDWQAKNGTIDPSRATASVEEK
jgi:hypothetical protein